MKQEERLAPIGKHVEDENEEKDYSGKEIHLLILQNYVIIFEGTIGNLEKEQPTASHLTSH